MFVQYCEYDYEQNILLMCPEYFCYYCKVSKNTKIGTSCFGAYKTYTYHSFKRVVCSKNV